MPRKYGFWFIVGMCLLSLPLLYFSVWTPTIEVLRALNEKPDEISFDSGTYYYILITIFWLFLVIEMLGDENVVQQHKKKLSWAIIGWFCISLLLAIVVPRYFDHKLEIAGYQACADPQEISRISPGKKLIYKLHNCELIAPE